jgi:hypothetical protein
MATKSYPLGRPVFWAGLVGALALWATTTGRSPLRVTLAVIGGGLAVAVQFSDEKRWAVERRLRRALMLSGYWINGVALTLFGDERRAPEVQRMLRGERPLDMARWEIALGKEFVQHYATLTLLEYGAPDYIGKGIKVMPEGSL